MKRKVHEQNGLSELQQKLDTALADAKHWRDEWIKSEQEKSNAIGNAFENGRLQKQNTIIGHIAAGRSNEAIQELLTPLPVAISMQVRFADDATRNLAENELLEKLKAAVIKSVQSTSITRQKESEL